MKNQKTVTKNDKKTIPKSKDVEVRLRKSYSFFNTIKENIGDCSKIDTSLLKNDDVFVNIKVGDTISELEFYKCFLHIKTALCRTVYDDKESKLTDVTIDYMAAIMCKPLDYTMPSNAKNMKQANLAKELNRSPKSAYSAINRLKKAGYLVVTEDNIIIPGPEYQKLRIITKAHFEKTGCFPVCYMLNFIVDDE
jgi:hypothetical protein